MKKNKVTSVKNSNTCVSHKCTWCGRKLKIVSRKQDWIVFGMMIVIGGSIIWGVNYISNIQSSVPDCYQRTLIIGDAMNTAVYSNVDIACPKHINKNPAI